MTDKPPHPRDRAQARGPKAASPQYDVAVLGSHLTAGLLAAILARHGARVVLVDTPGDRAGPTGETTVPYTSEVFTLLAERFNVPEIATFAHFTDLPEEVRRTSGIKRSLGFVYHDEGLEHDPRKAVQFNVPGEHTEWHLYRPQVDEYARRIAERYGVHTDGSRRVLTGARMDAEGGALTLAGGRAVAARYVVDASGPDSLFLAHTAAAHEGSGRMPVRSRLLSAHFSGVRPFETVVPPGRHPGTTPWSHGTFHHVFDGGWIQIVDFRNHDTSANVLCSVTAGVCPERFRDLPDDPDAAFRALISRYPSIAAQFATAVTATTWVSEPLWQRRTVRTSGPRWLAIDRAAVRAEEVLARDVTVGMEIVHAAAAGLLRVLANPARETEEFSRIAAFQARLIDYNDDLQLALRTASRHFQLFNAYLRVWLLWQILADMSLKRARMECGDGPGRSWAAVEEADSALWFRTPEGLRRGLRYLFTKLAAVRAGEAGATDAARGIFGWLRKERFVPPLYRFGDPKARVYTFTFWRRIQMLLWVKTLAPADFKRLLTRDNVTGRRQTGPSSPAAAPARPVTTRPPQHPVRSATRERSGRA
ncbi:tryptophan 7-halogenase [Streptomyces sp. NA02950]|uniref:NAD(P)/FAD-dependent oxidoreductase n=1 Tax=Streptomyces sp. NA02950 TaxID=2742137 RepID=UPI00159038E5|nr:tryptophan 7-halogenase [Streptomyces sp. NA02950]QKV90513.1 tryptophan 7-halogenase [Streptomyces sp. NA02950]